MSEYKTKTTKEVFLSERTHKAYKTGKTCAGCEKPIETGYFYTKTVGVTDGKFISTSWHPDCFKQHAEYVKEQNSKG